MGHSEENACTNGTSEVPEISDQTNKPMQQPSMDAKSLMESGHVEEAIGVLEKKLEQCPDDARNWNLLGLCRLRIEGPTERAAGSFEKAVQHAPHEPVFRNNLGSIRWQQGNFESAREHFELALERDPTNSEAWFNCANALQSLGRINEAQEALRKAASHAPQRADIRSALGVLMYRTGRLQEAVDVLENVPDPDTACLGNLGLVYASLGQLDLAEGAYRRALRLDNSNASLHGNLSSVLYRQGRLDEAVAECRRAIVSDPNSVQAYNNLGIALRDLGRTTEAIATLRIAMERQPDSTGIIFNLGIALEEDGNISEAAQCFEQALSRDPNWPAAVVNLGNTYYKLDRCEDARDLLQKAVDMGPHTYVASAYCSLGLILQRLGALNDALTCFDHAIRRTPDNATARFGRGMLLLKLGRFEKGWNDYEWRFFSSRFHYLKTPDWQTPEWRGEPLDGKSLLVYHEQGLGDAIHFVRYLPRVKALGATIIMVCGPPLFRLFESLEVVDEFLSRRDRDTLPFGNYDYHVPLMSLPRLFETRLDSIPSEVPYLDVPSDLEEKWRGRIPSDTYNIGIAWSGNPDQGANRHRSCELAHFAPLFATPGTQFFSLQKGEAGAALQDSESGAPHNTVIDLTDELVDMAETASLVKCLDLVITIDTSIAHLAGALAKPVWTVLWTNHCWRYLTERTDSPWYPTMKLFRQHTEGDWESVFASVADELREQLQTSRGDHAGAT